CDRQLQCPRRCGEFAGMCGAGFGSSCLPGRFAGSATPQFDFNRWVIDQTHEFASAYKPNIAFYEARGDAGLRDLQATIDCAPDEFQDCRNDLELVPVGFVHPLKDDTHVGRVHRLWPDATWPTPHGRARLRWASQPAI